jgi:hypothetical protein
MGQYQLLVLSSHQLLESHLKRMLLDLRDNAEQAKAVPD